MNGIDLVVAAMIVFGIVGNVRWRIDRRRQTRMDAWQRRCLSDGHHPGFEPIIKAPADPKH